MSKPSRRPTREARKMGWKEMKKARRELNRRQAEQGLEKFSKPTLPNTKSLFKTVEQEQLERQQIVEGQLKSFRALLPGLLNRLSKIPDPRNPKTVKHKLTVVLLYGLLIFVFNFSSRREAGRRLAMPQFKENLKLLFPELEDLLHHDTLNRVLSELKVDEIEAALVKEIGRLIRNRKFARYLVGKSYLVAIDGTRKFTRNNRWSEECLQQRVGEEDHQYYVYVLEANLVLGNGVTIPCLSEFLQFAEEDPEAGRQDCELKAFYRLAKRLKTYFPRLPITVLLDGLYANGPVIALCRRYKWDFMIVLKDDHLPSVWEEFHGLSRLQTGQSLKHNWGNRRQDFRWVNQIEYGYGPYGRYKQRVHVVVCEESWEDIDPKTGAVITTTSRHAWLSGKHLSPQNVVSRCNQMGRYRWKIENNILKEKHHGYQYEHCFSYNWNAMKGFHYLMRLGHFLNVLAHNSVYLVNTVRMLGMRGLVQFIRDTLSSPWLDAERILDLVDQPHQLRLA